MINVVFVCTGNTCRSPMAEYALRQTLREEWQIDPSQIEVSSAGLAAWNGESATPEAIEVMKEVGIDISGHKAALFQKEMAEDADHIYVMTGGHQKVLLEAFPELKGRVTVLGNGMDDPFGESVPVYRQCRDHIFSTIRPLAMTLRNELLGVGL